MSVFDTVLLILAAVFFFIAGIYPHVRSEGPGTAVNWLAWGLFCLALSMLPFF